MSQLGENQEPKLYTEEEIIERRKFINEEYVRRNEQERLYKENAITAQKLHDKAIELGMWIYDPENKQWFTPPEFLRLYQKYYINHPLFKRVKFKNPRDGIKAGYKQLNDLETRLKEFTQKIIDYYTGTTG
jgi:hypothetical protein